MKPQLRYDLLGSVKYQRRAIKGVKRGSCVAVLDRYFDKRAIVHDDWYRRVLRSKKNLTLLVHGVWKNNHRFNERDRKRAVRCAKRLQRIALEFPNKKIHYSPYLEHRNSNSHMKETLDRITNVAPCLYTVNSYIGVYGPLPFGFDYDEIHNDDWQHFTKLYLFSTDGFDVFETDRDVLRSWKDFHSKAEQFGVWAASFNGKKDPQDSTPPLRRKHWPTVRQIRQAARIYESL